MRTLLTIIFLTLLTTNSFSQRHITEDEMRMVEIIKRNEKEKVTKVFKRRDGFVVLIFPSTKYVIDSKYVQDVYVKQNGKWVDFTKIKKIMNSIEQQNEMNYECKLALSDTSNEEAWLEKYQRLYKRCIIKPQGRPSISLAFHNGEFFEEIDEFVTRYSNLVEPAKQWTDEDYLNLANDERLYSYVILYFKV